MPVNTIKDFKQFKQLKQSLPTMGFWYPDITIVGTISIPFEIKYFMFVDVVNRWKSGDKCDRINRE